MASRELANRWLAVKMVSQNLQPDPEGWLERFNARRFSSMRSIRVVHYVRSDTRRSSARSVATPVPAVLGRHRSRGRNASGYRQSPPAPLDSRPVYHENRDLLLPSLSHHERAHREPWPPL